MTKILWEIYDYFARFISNLARPCLQMFTNIAFNALKQKLKCVFFIGWQHFREGNRRAVYQAGIELVLATRRPALLFRKSAPAYFIENSLLGSKIEQTFILNFI